MPAARGNPRWSVSGGLPRRAPAFKAGEVTFGINTGSGPDVTASGSNCAFHPGVPFMGPKGMNTGDAPETKLLSLHMAPELFTRFPLRIQFSHSAKDAANPAVEVASQELESVDSMFRTDLLPATVQ
jgi:hypothetical protein